MLLYGLDPPPDQVQATERLELGVSPESVAAVRDHLASRLVAHGFGHAVEPATLCASELCTVLLGLGCERIDLVVVRYAGHLVVEFRCRGGARQFQQLLRDDHAAARALGVVDELSPLWGVRPADDGDAIWFEVR